ncbi:MAG: ABC transporter substrate-binding protein, partial [Acetobacteraceae bacterium]|nr:ABC transporter substrate-binding protein [Acetobacteraceae bacterium]
MSRHVRIGVLRLLDSAPVLLAEECGIFEKLGLRVEISIEPSWANVADKLTYGLLDAAVMLPPLVLAAVLGMGRPPAPLVVPMGISLGGNAVAMNPETGFDIWPGEGPLAMGRRLVGWMRAQPQRPRLAVVHAFSTHHLLLRYWLAASGADVAQDFHPVVVPPEHAVGALADGRVAAFCAGAPWGDLAEIAGVGRVVLSSSAIWSNHPEKCLAVAAPWAAAEPETLAALLRALLRAGAACDRPEQA